ncbi:hypothetical protein B0H21DRAFT_894338 [Amylocystis lapponica]|nr:hypothetical protein B0H21DRAFT_894338 [Amylocystis lapponica]
MDFSHMLSSDDIAYLTTLSPRNVQQWTWEKINQVEKYLLDLKSFHNSFAPINRLPNELLVDIFSHDRDRGKVPSMAWIRLTHVCRYWREIALMTPTLWSKIYLAEDSDPESEGINPILLHTCLLRSVPSKVDIVVLKAADEDASAILKDLRQHADRIRLLRIRFGAVSELLPFLSFPMPFLEELYLSPKHEYEKGSRDEDPYAAEEDRYEDYVLNLLPGQVPRLRSLTLKGGVAISWDPEVLSSLVHLDVSGILERKNALVMDDLLDLLDACHNLESLVMDGCLPTRDYDDRSTQSGRIVSCTKLRRLHLTDKARKIHLLLTHLAIPSCEFMRLHANFSKHSNDAPSMITALFPAHILSLPIFSLARMLDVDGLGAKLEVSAGMHPQPSEPPPLQIICTAPLGTRLPFKDPMRDVVKLFSSSPIITLILHVGEQDWNFLRDFPLLQDLRALEYIDYAVLLISALGDTRALLCPTLRKLAVEGYGVRSQSGKMTPIFDCLKSRAAQGAALEHVFVAPLIRGPETLQAIEELSKTLKGVRRCQWVRRAEDDALIQGELDYDLKHGFIHK